MGLLSGITKGIKNIFKGAKKVFKRAVSAVKSFVTSDLGKALITVAAIYFGGVALGAWGTGTSVAAPAVAATAETAATAATITPAATAVPFGVGGEALAATAAETAATTGTGLMSQLKGGAAAYEAWAKANPLTSKLVGGALVSLATAPDPNQALDVEKWRRSNMNVAGVDVGGSGVGSLNVPQLQRTTRYVDPQPTGLVPRVNRST